MEVRIPDDAASAALPVTRLHGASGAFASAPVALRRMAAYDCVPREALKTAISNRTLTTSSAFLVLDRMRRLMLASQLRRAMFSRISVMMSNHRCDLPACTTSRS